MIELWTDGSSNGKVGPGGWAFVTCTSDLIPFQGKFGGFKTGQTNNSMEMMAVEKGLKSLNPEEEVVVHTDSMLVIGWLSREWKCKHDHIRIIRDRIREIISVKGLRVRYEHVPGKSCPMAQLVDAMAKRGKEKA